MTDKNKLPRVFGVSRDFESPGGKGVLLSFERALTDDELRTLHDSLAPPAPSSVQEGQGGLTEAEALKIAAEQDYGEEDPKCILRLIRAVERTILARQSAPALDLSKLPLHYKEGVENGGYYLATDVIRALGTAPVLGSVVQADGLSPVYKWLEKAARCGLPEVEHGARTMMDYYQGAEFSAPQEQAAERVEAICDAYESGFGHGAQRDGKNGRYYDSDDFNQAYLIGYENGEAGANARANLAASTVERAAVPEGFVWPKPPARKGQSNVLFDDGYEEGWAKAIDTVRAMLAAAPVAQEGKAVDGVLTSYDPNIRWAKQRVRLTLKQWEYSGVLEVIVSGNCQGSDIFDSAIDQAYEDLLGGGDMARLTLTAANGDTLECDDDEERGEDWLARMVVGIEIIGQEPESAQQTSAQVDTQEGRA